MNLHPTRRRTPEEDAALWQRFRGKLGEPSRAGASAAQWLKSITAPAPQFDWAAFRHPAPHDPMRAGALRQGIWRAGAERYDDGRRDSIPWKIPGASLNFLDRMHRFEWLPHLCGDTQEGREQAVWLVDSWIDQFGRFDGFAWRAGPCSDRVWNWMRCGGVLFDDDSDAIVRQRLQALLRQIAHLDSLAEATVDVDARFRIALIQSMDGVLTRNGARLAVGLARLDGECTAQILPDGGHVSRSPERLLLAMHDLIALRGALLAHGEPVPDFLTKWLPRMAAMLSFFRCEDGALYPFNDSGESHPEVIDAALATLSDPPRRFSFSPKSGFQKLERGSLRLMLDVGRAPDQPFGDMAHAGALGFELSDGPARIVTSCGFSREVDLDFQAAVRRSGAHSTLVLGNRDNADFETNEQTGLLTPVGPDGISAKRLEEDDEIWLDAQHSGYRDIFGLLHRRRLFMNGNGTRLAGEDSLVRPVARAIQNDPQPVGFEIRFHLHPTVTALMGRGAIVLECGGGTRWRFKTSHANAKLEKSLYLARGAVEYPEQIVLSGRADPNGDGSQPPNCVRWAFLKEE